MKQQNTFTRIYDIVRQIPCGFVTTYGQIALLIGQSADVPRSGIRPARQSGAGRHSMPSRSQPLRRFKPLHSPLAKTTSNASCLKERA